MRVTIKIVSALIILLGLLHTYVALFCRYMDEDGLWFVGAGFALIFAGLINFLAIDRGGSKFTHAAALASNTLMLFMFCYALPILDDPQVFAGIALFAVTTIAFLVKTIRQNY